MNNNRNNRRRGRGNRSNQSSDNQLNRIDSRARGNAPQMLDKYKKLAQDAQHNGDRVQMEYYLQFADHYFRVIADNKARMDEARGKRGDDREQVNDDSDDFDDGDNRHRTPRRPQARREDQRDDQRDYQRDDADAFEAEGEVGFEGGVFDQDEPAQDIAEPTRRVRKPRAPKSEPRAPKSEPRVARARKPRNGASGGQANGADPHADEGGGGIDSSVLPPAIRVDSGYASNRTSDGDSDASGDDTFEAVG